MLEAKETLSIKMTNNTVEDFKYAFIYFKPNVFY